MAPTFEVTSPWRTPQSRNNRRRTTNSQVVQANFGWEPKSPDPLPHARHVSRIRRDNNVPLVKDAHLMCPSKAAPSKQSLAQGVSLTRMRTMPEHHHIWEPVIETAARRLLTANPSTCGTSPQHIDLSNECARHPDLTLTPARVRAPDAKLQPTDEPSSWQQRGLQSFATVDAESSDNGRTQKQDARETERSK